MPGDNEPNPNTPDPNKPNGNPPGGEGGEGGEDIQIPDPLTANIKEIIEKTRTQERTKLYKTIEQTKAEAKAAKEALAAEQAQSKKLAEALEAITKGQKPKETGDDGEPKNKKESVSEEKMAAALAKGLEHIEAHFAKVLEATQKESQAKLDAVTNQLKQEKLDSYRNRLISENQDAIIEELVKGSTEDELTQSLVEAKQAFARLSKKLGKAPNGDGDDGTATRKKLVLPPVPTIGGHQAPGAPSTIDVTNLSQGDYAKQREQVLAAASAAMRSSLSEAD
jgi:hypothetical protein